MGFSSKHVPAQITLNPQRSSFKKLLQKARAEQEKHIPHEGINIGSSDSSEFDQTFDWCDDGEGGIEGSQMLVLVALVNGMEVGYTTIFLSISRMEDLQTLLVTLNLDMIYVFPSLRGNGYGVDLSIASSILAKDLMTAAYRSMASSKYEISFTIAADYFSTGGEQIAESIFDELEFHRVFLSDANSSSVKLSGVVLDAGW